MSQSEIQVHIYRQKRDTLMMRPIPGGVEVYIPHTMRKNDRRVKRFVQDGLKQLAGDIPPIPPERTSREAILNMVDEYAARMDVQPARVQLRDMRRKWGSCSSRGTVTLNTRLMWVAPHLAEYIVCHEVAHLRELNHSDRFWQLLAAHMPDYKTRLNELKRVEKTLW